MKKSRKEEDVLRFRKILCILTIITLIFGAFFISPSPAAATTLETEAKSAVLIDAQSGQILFEKNAHEERPMASVTKVMTMYIILDAIAEGRAKLSDEVVTSENAASFGGSQVWLEPGEIFTLEKMLIAIAVGSANDACVAVAEHLYGSEKEFVAKMNEKVAELGLKHTHFANCHGLPAEGHYTSAYDMAVISRSVFLKYPLFRELVAMQKYEFRPKPNDLVLWNTNKLLWWYEGADGIKTGWIRESGYCLSATAKRGDLRLIGVVLGCPVPRSHFHEMQKLFTWGFANFEGYPIVKKGTVLKTIKVHKGKEEQLEVVAPEDFCLVVKKGEDKGKIKTEIKLPDSIKAPVKKGEKVGVLIASKDGKEIGRLGLVAKKTVEKGNVLFSIKSTIKKLFKLSV